MQFSRTVEHLCKQKRWARNACSPFGPPHLHIVFRMPQEHKVWMLSNPESESKVSVCYLQRRKWVNWQPGVPCVLFESEFASNVKRRQWCSKKYELWDNRKWVGLCLQLLAQSSLNPFNFLSDKSSNSIFSPCIFSLIPIPDTEPLNSLQFLRWLQCLWF